jgi:TM2 domain-containing membrane protein YozV
MDTMPYTEPVSTAQMNEAQRAWFYAEYAVARRDEIAGVVLAIFLGSLGVHHFYLRRYGLGILYLVFSWTGIPMILGWIECFFMPGRVRAYNVLEASVIAAQILAYPAPPAGPYVTPVAAAPIA